MAQQRPNIIIMADDMDYLDLIERISNEMGNMGKYQFVFPRHRNESK